ncbi:MAG TPA: LuxR C-terminal-related transcriptional regulator [Actinospica sp.]|nr:LuxR C-terminal-related transcriptional regulator [Actinospica sp.]
MGEGPGRMVSVDVLRGAAVLGAEFSLRELAVVLDRPAEELRTLIDEAVEAGVLRAEGGLLRFREDEVRLELYEAMPAGLRMALHRYTAKILSTLDAAPERIAAHLLAAGDEIESWEADWLIEHAAAVFAGEPDAAVELIGHVLRGIDAADPRYAVLEDRWALYAFELDRFELAGRIARGILTFTEEPHRVGPAVWVLALSLMTGHRFEEALGLLEGTGSRTGVPPFWRARNDAVRAVVLEILGRLDEGRAAAERALSAEVGPPDPFAVGAALYLRSIVRAARRDTAGALEDVERGLVALNQAPDLVDLRMLLLGNRYAYRFALGRRDGTEDAMREVLDLAETTRSLWRVRVRRQATQLRYDLGLWDEIDDRHAIGALIAAHRDDEAEIARYIKALAAEIGQKGYDVAARALIHERNGNARDAIAVLATCLEPGGEDVFPLRHVILPKLVRLAVEQEPATARAAAEAAQWEADREPTPRKLAGAAWCRGVLDADPEAVLGAAGYLREAGLRLYAASALEDAAGLFAQAGDSRRARATLAEALDGYEELGATWDARRAASRLRGYDVRLGVRGSRARPDDDGGGTRLTATEQRVAELAAEGYSNPDIAFRMFLSKRTVDTHISNILSKLQIGSRREIRDRLSPDGP